jgi:hypothetical protein
MLGQQLAVAWSIIHKKKAYALNIGSYSFYCGFPISRFFPGNFFLTPEFILGL